jgi:uncharacterized protein YggU (UPF0235/DUF167 family)
MNPLAVTENPRGTVLPVRARPGARRNRLVDVHDGSLRIDVVTAPEQGKANDAIVALLASELNLRRGQIELIAGATHRDKKFLVVGITPRDLNYRVESVLEPTAYMDPDARPDASAVPETDF